MPYSWSPLVSGIEATRFTAVIDQIVSDTDTLHGSTSDWGRALLHLYLGQARHSDVHKAEARRCVERATERLQRAILGPSLYGGVAGVGWLCAHSDRLFNTESHDYDELDDYLLDSLESSDSRIYDLISGDVGLAVYFLERSGPSATAGMNKIMDRLWKGSIVTPAGRTWFTPPDVLPAWQREFAPAGYFNLGVAHGVPGIVGVLAHALRTPRLQTSRALDLLRSTLDWLAGEWLPAERSYPAWRVPGTPPATGRVAWCYGPLGLSVTFLGAARAIGQQVLEQRALEVALETTHRRQDAGVRDASLCHGTAGIAHLYNRLFQATRRPEFRAAALHWLEETLEMRGANGPGGYQSWRPAEGLPADPDGWKDDPTFLTGATGIALGLLAATTPLTPAWDRVLLADCA